MGGGTAGSPQEAGAGWDGRPQPRPGKGTYLRLHLTHTFHRKSTTKGTFNLGGCSGRRREAARQAAAPLTLYSARESRAHRWPLRKRATSRPRRKQPGLGMRPPPAVGSPRRPPVPPLLWSHAGRGCCAGLSEKPEQEARSGGWSQTGSRAWRCVPWRPHRPGKAACLSLPPCKVGILGRHLGMLWRLTASRGSKHPPASYVLSP